jgi:hypothetical protein
MYTIKNIMFVIDHSTAGVYDVWSKWMRHLL